MTKKPFNNLLKKTAEASANRALFSSKNAARKLILLMQKENPESVTMLLELPDKKIVADVAVSVDGTWQKRGHSSRIGVVFILLIDTGEVLDYDI